MEYVSVDAHKRYSFVSIEDQKRKVCCEARIEHRRGAIREFLSQRVPGSPVAVERVGNRYWIVGEKEEAEWHRDWYTRTDLKMMLASGNKIDRLESRKR